MAESPRIFYAELHGLDGRALALIDQLWTQFALPAVPRFSCFEDRASYIVAHALRTYARSLIPATYVYESRTHTKGMAAVCMSGTGPVGIDAETMNDNGSILAVAPYFMSPRELAVLSDGEPGGHVESVTRLWTAKEALSKAVGLGASLAFRNVSFALNPLSLVDAPAECGPCSQWSFFERNFPRSHAVTFVCRGKVGTVTPVWHPVSLSSLMAYARA